MKTAKQKLPTVDLDLLPTSKEIENINADLIVLKKEFGDQETDFQRKKVAYSADMVVEALKKQKQPETKKDKNRVVDFIEQYAKDAAITKKAGSITFPNSFKKSLIFFKIIDFNRGVLITDILNEIIFVLEWFLTLFFKL